MCQKYINKYTEKQLNFFETFFIKRTLYRTITYYLDTEKEKSTYVFTLYISCMESFFFYIVLFISKFIAETLAYRTVQKDWQKLEL